MTCKFRRGTLNTPPPPPPPPPPPQSLYCPPPGPPGSLKITDLNNDCLDLVLSHFQLIELVRLRVVCRQWYKLCTYKMSSCRYFSTVTFKDRPIGWNLREKYADRIVDDVLAMLSLIGRNLKTISLSKAVGLNAKDLSLMAEMLPNLQELDLRFCCKFDKTLAQVIGHKICPSIECLRLRPFHPKHINMLLKRSRKLKFFSITSFDCYHEQSNDSDSDDYADSDSSFDDPDSILHLKDCLSAENPLISVCFPRFHELHPESMCYVFESFAKTLQHVDLSYTYLQGLTNCSSNLPQLTNMKTFIAPNRPKGTGLRHSFGQPHLQNQCADQLLSVVQLMPNLRVLDLTGNDHVPSRRHDFVEILSKSCPLLEELFLGCCCIPAETLVNLQKLVFLRRLYLDHHSATFETRKYDFAASFKSIATLVLPHLKELEYFSLTHSTAFWADTFTGRSVDEHDLFQFVKNAGPKFKDLFVGAANKHYDGDQYDFVAKAVEMCSALDRNGMIRIFVENLDEAQRSASLTDHFDSISPPFLKVIFPYPHYMEKLHSCDVLGRYIDLPNFFPPPATRELRAHASWLGFFEDRGSR